MKAVFALCAALSLASLAQAQVFRPHAVRGDHDRRSHSVERHRHDHRGSHGWHRGHSRSWDRHYRHHAHRPSIHVSLGVGSGYWRPYYHRPYVYRRPVYYPVPVYRDYGPAYDDSYGAVGYRTEPSRAVTGALLGGIAGAIIGNNSGSHDAWQGAAIGAGAGLVLGAVADNAARDRSPGERPPVYVQSREPAPAAPAAPEARNVTIINNYYGNGSAMGSANRMFGR